MVKAWKYIIGILVLITVVVWLAVYSYPEDKLKIVACDVGQGDAILATVGSTQVLFDGGANNKVVECLDAYMPFWDRKVEVIVLSHPQRDHFFGLIEVFERYEVEKFVATSLESSSKEYQVLKELVGGSNTHVVMPTTGMSIGNSTIQLDIVHPSQAYVATNTTISEGITKGVLGATITKRDPNDFSVVTILRFGDFDALFTGDIGPDVMDEVIATGKVSDVEYLKVPHHGSKNGLTEKLLETSTPEVAVISVGKNQWGHPHKEVLDMLGSIKATILRTDEAGDVVIVTDGTNFEVVR